MHLVKIWIFEISSDERVFKVLWVHKNIFWQSVCLSVCGHVLKICQERIGLKWKVKIRIFWTIGIGENRIQENFNRLYSFSLNFLENGSNVFFLTFLIFSPFFLPTLWNKLHLSLLLEKEVSKLFKGFLL